MTCDQRFNEKQLIKKKTELLSRHKKKLCHCYHNFFLFSKIILKYTTLTYWCAARNDNIFNILDRKPLNFLKHVLGEDAALKKAQLLDEVVGIPSHPVQPVFQILQDRFAKLRDRGNAIIYSRDYNGVWLRRMRYLF